MQNQPRLLASKNILQWPDFSKPVQPRLIQIYTTLSLTCTIHCISTITPHTIIVIFWQEVTEKHFAVIMHLHMDSLNANGQEQSLGKKSDFCQYLRSVASYRNESTCLWLVRTQDHLLLQLSSLEREGFQTYFTLLRICRVVLPNSLRKNNTSSGNLPPQLPVQDYWVWNLLCAC